jgi:hypothetical protein
MNGRKARESGLQPNAQVAPGPVPPGTNTEPRRPACLGRWDQRLQPRPLRIRQITRKPVA